MVVIRVTASTICAAALAVSMAADRQAAPPQDGLRAFTGARLVDPATARVTESATLLVRGGRIVAAGPGATVRIPNGATTRDLGGQFVVPGLISTHVHISDVNGDRPREDPQLAQRLSLIHI